MWRLIVALFTIKFMQTICCANEMKRNYWTLCNTLFDLLSVSVGLRKHFHQSNWGKSGKSPTFRRTHSSLVYRKFQNTLILFTTNRTVLYRLVRNPEKQTDIELLHEFQQWRSLLSHSSAYAALRAWPRQCRCQPPNTENSTYYRFPSAMTR